MAQAEAEAFAAQSLHKTILENVEALRQQRAGLVADIAKLNDELLDLSKRLEEVRRHHERELSTLQTTKSNEQQELMFLRQEVSRLRGNVDGLEPVKRHLEASIADRQTQLARLDARMADARGAVEEYTSQIEQARLLWNEVVTRATEETRKLDAMRNEVASLEPQRKEALVIGERLASLRTEQVDLQAAVEELTGAEAELRVKVASLTVDFEEQKKKELEFLRKQNDAELALSRARMERDALASRNAELKKENEALAERLGQNHERKTLMEQEIHTLQAKIKNLQGGLEPLRQQVQMKEEDIRRLNGESDAVRNSLRELAALLGDREKRLDIVNGRHEEMVAENRRLEGVVETLKNQEEGWRVRIAEAQRQLASLRADTERGQRELGELNGELRKFRELNEQVALENTALQEALGKVQCEFADLQRQRMKVQEELEALRAERDARLAENGEAQERLNGLEALCREWSAEAELRKARLADLDGEIATKRAFAERMDKELEGLETRREAEGREVEALGITLKELRVEAASMERRIEELTNVQAGLASVEARVAELKRSEEESQASLGSLRKTERAVSSRIEMLEKQESELLGRIDKARSNLSETEQSHGSLMQKTTTAEERFEKVSRNLEELTKKRDSVAELLKRDAEAVREARDQLRSLEDLKTRKLKELQELRNDFATLESRRETQAQTSEPHLRVTSAEVRAEAERTLENLRRHLGGIEKDKGSGNGGQG